jgi:hypothetical protein
MEIKETEIEGVYILKPDIYGDSRGYFFESYNKERFNSLIPGALILCRTIRARAAMELCEAFIFRMLRMRRQNL